MKNQQIQTIPITQFPPKIIVYRAKIIMKFLLNKFSKTRMKIMDLWISKIKKAIKKAKIGNKRNIIIVI